MRVAALIGDRTAGLRAYHACVSALRDELGIEPSRETLNAYQRLVERSTCPNSGPGPDRTFRPSQSWSAETRSGMTLVDGWSRAPEWSVDARPDRG